MSKYTGISVDLGDLDGGEYVDQMKEIAAMEFSVIGEEYVNEARTKGLNLKGLKIHKNWTHVLKNSHSYVVFIDGVSRFSDIGKDHTLAMFESVKTGKGVELIVGNGAEYASYVEGKGYDVVSSGFLYVESEVKKIMK